jgi:CheY-like chemotaxis protein
MSDRRSAETDARKPSILLVEDDPELRETLRDLLAEEGYPVRVAADGREALALLRGLGRPGLVLLDLWMPLMTGGEFLDAARAAGLLGGVAVVVMTAAPLRRPPAGADALLKKPMDLEELLAAVEGHATPAYRAS